MNWWEKMGFCREKFYGLLTRIVYRPLSLQTIMDKIIANRHKTAKFANFSTSKVIIMVNHTQCNYILTHHHIHRPLNQVMNLDACTSL